MDVSIKSDSREPERSTHEAPSMGANYIFSLTPTFTQGLILGQLSILLLLSLILKYLFLDSGPSPPFNGNASLPQQAPSPSHEKERENISARTQFTFGDEDSLHDWQGREETESARWFNLLVHHVRRPVLHSISHLTRKLSVFFGR